MSCEKLPGRKEARALGAVERAVDMRSFKEWRASLSARRMPADRPASATVARSRLRRHTRSPGSRHLPETTLGDSVRVHRCHLLYRHALYGCVPPCHVLRCRGVCCSLACVCRNSCVLYRPPRPRRNRSFGSAPRGQNAVEIPFAHKISQNRKCARAVRGRGGSSAG